MLDASSRDITFLFTDVEGSTRMWEEHPDSIREALARHDHLASSIIDGLGGELVRPRGEGDSLFAVFPDPARAVTAACALQRAYVRELWPDGLSLRVRMALHAGQAEYRDGDYYGADVNRCARIRAVAHGGQVLISRAVAQRVRDYLPEGATLRDCGEHLLKDLGQPENIFQLCHPDLPTEYPPLRSAQSRQNNLPRQLTSFIGRQKELAEVKALLSDSRLLTLTGSGGIGKTRLAIQSAVDLVDAGEAGAWLVELAPLTEAGAVPRAVASALGLKEEPGRSLVETLIGFLADRRLMLILDNCEHLLDASARLAESILTRCPEVRILATSREGLGIGGERAYRVPSLELPDANQERIPEKLEQAEAVGLFVERARLQRNQFAVTEQNGPALAAICRRLDGIPLAIELAAARTNALSPEEIASRLDQRFRLLTGGSRTALPRHQTLRSLIDWSYDLLNHDEKALLCRLSVFSGGWTLEAAEEVCGGDVLTPLESLVEKSLVSASEADGRSRYRLLESIRQYARDRLLERGEGEAWRARHCQYYTSLAERAAPEISRQDSAAWLARLDADHDNMIAALEWCRETEGDEAPVGPDSGRGRQGLRLCAALWLYWDVRGYFADAFRRFTEALAHPDAQSRTPDRATVLNSAAIMARNRGDYEAARPLFDEALAIRREVGDRSGEAHTLSGMGALCTRLGEHGRAETFFAQALAIRREIGDRAGEELILTGLGSLAISRGDRPAARKWYEEALAVNRETGNRGSEAFALTGLGCIAEEEGDYARSRSLLEQALAINRELGRRAGEASNVGNLSLVLRHEGDLHGAASLAAEALFLNAEIGDPVAAAECLANLSLIALDLGDGAAAARLLSAAENQRIRTGTTLQPHEREAYDRAAEMIRVAVGAEAFDAERAAGHALAFEAAVRFAREWSGRHGRHE